MKKSLIKKELCRRGCGLLLPVAMRAKWQLPLEIKEKYHLVCDKCLMRKERDEIFKNLGVNNAKK